MDPIRDSLLCVLVRSFEEDRHAALTRQHLSLGVDGGTLHGKAAIARRNRVAGSNENGLCQRLFMFAITRSADWFKGFAVHLHYSYSETYFLYRFRHARGRFRRFKGLLPATRLSASLT